MGLFHELLVTTIIAALLSFIIAKLVSAIVGADDHALKQKDSKFGESSVVFEEKGMKVGGFGGEKIVEAVDHAVVEKVDQFDGGENPVGLEDSIGLPGKLSEESSREETKEFDYEEVMSVSKDEDGFFVDENKEFRELSARNEEKNVIGDDDLVKDEEFCEESDELRRDVIDDLVKDGEFTAKDEVMKAEGNMQVKYDEVKRDSVIDDGVKDGEFSLDSGELKRDFIDDEVKDGEFSAKNEAIKDEGNSEVKDDEVKCGGINENYKGFGNEKDVSQEVLLGDDLDDGWEGIEISEMEKIFAEATKFVASKDNFERVSSFGSDVLMELDALHSVVAEGPCLEPQPMALRVSARAKWNARQKLGDMNPDTALEQYVALLSEKIPGWMEETSENIKSGLPTGAIPSTSDCSLSTDPRHQPHYTTERPLEPSSGVKEGDLVETKDLDTKDIK